MSSEKELFEKKAIFGKLNKSYKQWVESIDVQEKEKNKIQKMIEDYQQQLQEFPMNFESQ